MGSEMCIRDRNEDVQDRYTSNSPQMLPVPGRNVKHFREEMLQILGALAVFQVDLLRILRVLSSISRFYTADTSGLAVFRELLLWLLPVLKTGLMLWLLRVLQAFWGSALRVPKVLAVIRPLLLRVLRALAAPKFSQFIPSSLGEYCDDACFVSIISCPLFIESITRWSQEWELEQTTFGGSNWST